MRLIYLITLDLSSAYFYLEFDIFDRKVSASLPEDMVCQEQEVHPVYYFPSHSTKSLQLKLQRMEA